MTKSQQGIVVCAFLYQDDKLLIAKRAAQKKFLPGVWEVIGGHVEFGETLEEALKREAREELHIEMEIEGIFDAFTYIIGDNEVHEVELVFFARLQDSSQQVQINPDDHSEYRWITSQEVKTFLDSDNAETKTIEKGFELLLNKSKKKYENHS